MRSLFAIGTLSLCALAFGQVLAADPIDTDGPDFVESSEVVPKGRFQYELALSRANASADRALSRSFTTPALLKYGLTDKLELRIAPEGYIRQDGKTGWADTEFGMKWHSQDREPEENRPAISWILHFDASTGSRDFRGNGIRPSIRSVLTWDLPDEYALGVMPGIKSDTTDKGKRFNSGILGVVLNKKITEKNPCFY